MISKMEGKKVSLSDSEDFFYYHSTPAIDNNEFEREDLERRLMEFDSPIRAGRW